MIETELLDYFSEYICLPYSVLIFAVCEVFKLMSNKVGVDTKLIQSALIERGYEVKMDGNYGAFTKLAVEEFQAVNNLVSDGICGPKTLQLLGISTGNGKRYFKWDTEKHFQFNIRLLTLISSVILCIPFLIFDRSQLMIFSLVVTFCLTNAFYNYVVKIVLDRFKKKDL